MTSIELTPRDVASDARVSAILKRVVQTDAAWAPTVARVTLGVVMLPHGAQKVLGWFGGGGFSATFDYFTGTMNLPASIAVLVIAIEFFGSLALLIGAFTRLAAAGIAAVMFGAIATVHAKVGFFMDWYGTMNGEGFEYHLLAIGLALVLVLRGGGRLSLDARLSRTLS